MMAYLITELLHVLLAQLLALHQTRDPSIELIYRRRVLLACCEL